MANSNTVIPHGLRADIMRKHMENKNTLTKKGSLYVGTGTTYSSDSPDYFSNIQCYKTEELEPVDVAGKPLVSKGLDGSNNQLGIEWGQVKAAGVGNQAVVGVAGDQGYTGTHNSKICYNSIGNNDIADRTIQNIKLNYDAVQIGDSIYPLRQSVAGGATASTTTLVGLTQVTSSAFNGGTVTGTIITASNYFNASSDERLKTNIKEYNTEKSILDVPVKEFDYKDTGKHTIGFIAQDLQKLFPELITTDENGYLGIQETKLIYLLLLEVKRLQEKIKEMEE